MARLTARGRKQVAAKNFAYPSGGIQFMIGATEKAIVRRKVKAKYPSIKIGGK
jgi:hypothetical protein